tara:strand:- start:181 stop:477 length:297 start_codon:yes stop_codon:yes gene_type:complete
MRKVTREIREAWLQGKPKTVNNTYTDGNSVWLFGNKIIEVRDGKVYATLANWPTRTTMDRLNGITTGTFYTRKYVPRCTTARGDFRMNSSEWYEVGDK